MFRSSPPSGRARRCLAVAALLCSAVFATPATAQTPSEAPTEPPSVSVPATVTGLDPLVVTAPDAADTAVTVTDVGGEVGTWILDPAAAGEDGAYALDLGAPDEGVAPVNGPATIAVAVEDVQLLSASVLLDRDPATPVLTAAASQRWVRLDWTPVTGPGEVRYAVQRATVEDSWVTLARGLAATVHRDVDAVPGRTSYRVTAAVPAADGGLNHSAPGTVTVSVPATLVQQPPPPPPPPPSPPPATPDPDQPDPAPRADAESGTKKQRTPHRKVAVAGDIRRGVAVRPQLQRPSDYPTGAGLPEWSTRVQRPRYVLGPRIARAPLPVPSAAPAVPAAPAPSVAVPRIQPLPLPAGSAGMLAVHAARNADAARLGDGATLLSATLLAVMLARIRRRREQLSPAPVDLR